ncbi:unnamed protein product [Didymodactylos carnosus]|uniref:WH1 domain-containing protein n=1 Tax=Didymodactylos carnosus TaxID=1234261 RepID=A0A814FL03_9BILA|nr:unnamed protein product [Didymodactylos carnosus]CAF0984429.1 unnamed protein product [Didymodactylos carnosus]CAF3650376.1 unnamed protein product [Didymodactylos carnosus]CAF3756729.1 unnamed protein product [Didymodactylos carnosus]
MHLEEMGEQHPLFTCKAHIFQVDSETRKSWVQLSIGAVNVQIFHDSVKNIYRILSIENSQSEADWSVYSNDEQLKYENDSLKLALTQSSQNAKQWQNDLETLRNNNVKLTTALQESHSNVEEWKRQLQFYRDECSRLRLMVANHTVGSTSSGHNAQELKSLLDAADQRNKEQEQKMFALENQVQKYMSQIGTLQSRLSSVESNNYSLNTELKLLHRQTPQRDNVVISGTSRSRPMSPGNNVNNHRHKLVSMNELFITKSQDFHDTIQAKSQDLQRLCQQISQSVAEL